MSVILVMGESCVKRFLCSTFVALVLMSGVAWLIQPPLVSKGKTQLTMVTDDNPVRQQQLDLFNKLNPDCQINLDPANTGSSKIIVQSLAGVGPDLFDCNTVDDLSAYVEAGIAWDITDELKKHGIDENKTVWKVGLKNLKYNNRIYGCSTNAATDCIWLNKDMFKKAGIPLPEGKWTWKEFLPVAQKLTIKDASGRVRQFGLLLDWFNGWQQFIWQWGGRVYSSDGTRCVVDSPEATAGIQFMQDLVYKYKVTPTPSQEQEASAGGWGSGYISLFGAGKSAMAMGGRWWLCSLRSYKDLHLGAVECPYEVNRVFIGYTRATLINKNSQNRDKALKFLIYASQRPYNELINHQADALAPVVKYCYTDTYLHDPAYPNEDFNAVWRDSMRYAKPAEASPFINGAVAQRIFMKQLDMVKANQKSAKDAMKAAAQQVNNEIQKNIQRNPKLKAEYDKLMGSTK